MTLEEKIRERLNNMSETDLFYIWNEYCECVGYYDDKIDEVYYLDDLLYGLKPTEILDRYSWVNTSDTYMNIYNEVSSDYVSDLISFDDLMDAIIENNESYGNDEIESILNDEEEVDYNEDEARFEDEF